MTLGRSEIAEVVIVGAGVIGLATAFELARRGRRSLVLDRGRPGRGATWAAGGMLAPVSEAEFETPELIEFACESLRGYPRFAVDVERIARRRVGYRADGTIWVAIDRDGAAELAHLASILADRGLRARRLGADEVRAAEPHLTGRVLEGLQVASDHQLDPRSLCRALEAAAVKLGARVVGAAAVERVACDAAGRLEVHGRGAAGEPFTVEAGTVVVAAGAGTAEGLSLPVEGLGLRPVKGQLVRLRGARLIRHVVRTPHVYLVPREDGELLLGATMEEMGFDTTATAGATMDLLRHAWEVLPGSYDLELAEVSVGLRSAVDDHLPVVGATEVDGLFLAVGHFRHGVLLAPATARYLARWIVEGREPPELAPFTPRRLARERAAGGR